MENGTSKFHQNTRRTERKALAAGFCTLFSKSPLRRVTALVLVTAIALGFTVTAVAQQVDPVQVTDPAEFPTITVETNLVMNEASGLPDIITDGANKYGFIEVSLRVTPGTSGLFSGAALALTYDETILTPVTWNQLDETTGKRDKYEVVNTTTSVIPFDIFLSTKKADIISTASAYVGGSDGAGKSLLYLNAESEYPTPLAGDSRLVVVRFRYDATANPLTYDATAKAIMNGANAVTFLGWASDANAALSFAGANAYFTGKNEPLVRESMYYIHKDPNPAAWTKTDADGLSMPDTACFQLVKAVKPGGTSTDADYYSYASNFFPVDATYMASFAPPLTEPKIKFTQVTAATADQGSGGISLDDIVTVVFFDWDDTFLGATAVARGMDSREAIDTYVKENMIHPELRAKTQADFATKSREMTYRGEQPATGPGGTGAIKEDADGDGVIDTTAGSRFPLTNKLDYAYYMDFDDEFLFDDGWAQVASADEVENTWTTIGVGELSAGAPPTTIDFNLDMVNLPAGTASVFAKAIYAPGALLSMSGKGDLYAPRGTVSYFRYGNAQAYAMRFGYERISEDGFGVKRMCEPAVQMGSEISGNTVFTQVVIENAEKVTVELTTAKETARVSYRLIDTYGSDFISGTEKSGPSEFGEFSNYDTSGAQGSDGFVKFGTLTWLANAALKVAEEGSSTEWAYANYIALNDCGLRQTAAGAAFKAAPPTQVNNAKARLKSMMTEKPANEKVEDITWYQLQYAVLQTKAPYYVSAATALSWCEANCTFII